MKKLLLVVLGMLLAAPAGWACSCYGKTSTESSYRANDVVVKAVMIRQEVVMGIGSLAALQRRLDESGVLSKYEIDSSFTGVWYTRYTFTIDHSYKGMAGGRTIVVLTGRNEAECGIEFAPDKAYLIYASLKDGRYWAHLCDRTREYNPAEATELAKLQRQAQPLKPKGHKGQRRQKPGTKQHPH